MSDMCLPLSFISPESKCKRPTIQLSRVVFPQPLGPNNPYLNINNKYKLYFYLNEWFFSHVKINYEFDNT